MFPPPGPANKVEGILELRVGDSVMAGANAGAVVTVKVFVEQDQITPMRVLLELLTATVNRAGCPSPRRRPRPAPSCRRPAYGYGKGWI